jgi:hypothetical protein
MPSRVWRTDPDTGIRTEWASAEDALAYIQNEIKQHRKEFGIQEAPFVRPDAIEFRSMVDGKMATSKSKYYKDVARAGCYINDKAPRSEEVDPREIKLPKADRDIAAAWTELESK